MSTEKTSADERAFTDVVRAKVRPSLKKRVEDYALKRDMMEAEVVRRAVVEYLEREEAALAEREKQKTACLGEGKPESEHPTADAPKINSPKAAGQSGSSPSRNDEPPKKSPRKGAHPKE